MRATEATPTISRLGRDECLARLAGDEIGRLGYIDGAAPLVIPVNYALDGETIVIRSDGGRRVAVGPRSPACFEVDAIDRASRAGWSVVVRGRLEEITRFDGPAFDRALQLDLVPWAGGEKDHYLRLVPTSITGRSVRRA